MSERVLMEGNHAAAEGAIAGGCRFFFGYPITPQNQIPEYMSGRLPEVGQKFGRWLDLVFMQKRF